MEESRLERGPKVRVINSTECQALDVSRAAYRLLGSPILW
jgi:hypothetical protein